MFAHKNTTKTGGILENTDWKSGILLKLTVPLKEYIPNAEQRKGKKVYGINRRVEWAGFDSPVLPLSSGAEKFQWKYDADTDEKLYIFKPREEKGNKKDPGPSGKTQLLYMANTRRSRGSRRS